MTEEFCEQCGQALVPNARFCTACGWETGSQATLPLPQGMTGKYSSSDYPQQGEPTPLEEFEQEFERQSTYEPAYDPYDQYGNDSYATDDSYSAADTYTGNPDDGHGNDARRNDKKKRNGTKGKASKKSPGQTTTKRATGRSAKNTAGTSNPRETVKSRKHPVTAVAIAILACIVVLFSGIGIVRMMATGNGTASGSGANSSVSDSTNAKGGTASRNNQNSEQSGKSSATGTKPKKTTAQQQDSQPPADGRYTNARFGYAITGMTITAWGSNNALNATVASAFEQATAGHSVSYQQMLDSEFTATWEENGTITYIREMVANGAIRAVQFTYPSANRDECDRIVEQVVPTLTATSAGVDTATTESGQ